MCFLRVFKKFLKVVRGGKNGVKWGKKGVKSLPQNPHLYTTDNTYNRAIAFCWRNDTHNFWS